MPHWTLRDTLRDLVALPARLTVAAVGTTLALGELVAPDGPVRQPGGVADRIMLVVGEGGVAERLAAALHPGRPLGRALAPGGTVDRLLEPDGLLDRLLTEDGFVDKLIADGGTLDQLVALGATLESISPRLAELADLVPELHASVDALNRAVEPLGGLANRLPGRRRPAVEA